MVIRVDDKVTRIVNCNYENHTINTIKINGKLPINIINHRYIHIFLR